MLMLLWPLSWFCRCVKKNAEYANVVSAGIFKNNEALLVRLNWKLMPRVFFSCFGPDMIVYVVSLSVCNIFVEASILTKAGRIPRLPIRSSLGLIQFFKFCRMLKLKEHVRPVNVGICLSSACWAILSCADNKTLMSFITCVSAGWNLHVFLRWQIV